MVETQPNAMGDAPPAQVRTIQSLRGVAALGVLVFHVAERAGGSFGLGAAGVDIFFVISGFIMWTVTCRRTPTPGDFLVRRMQRIAPLYWGVTLATAILAIAVPAAFPVMRPTLAHVLKSLFFIPYREAGLIAPLIVPGWTLNYEMFFYALFALALLASTRLRPWLLSAALIALVAVRPFGPADSPLWATYTNPLLLEFGAGVWIGKAWIEDRLPRRPVAGLMIAVGLISLIAVAASGVDVERARPLLWGLPALLIVAGFVAIERAGPVRDPPALRLLGDASYSVYLVHGLAISAAVRGLAVAGLTSPVAIGVGGMAVGLAAGLLTYQFVERPLTALMQRRNHHRKNGDRAGALDPAP